MPSEKLSNLTRATSVALTDLLYAVLDPDGTPTSRAIALSDLLNGKIGSSEIVPGIISGFAEEPTPESGDFFLVLTPSGLRQVNIGNLTGLDWSSAVNSNIIPDTDGTYTLGTALARFLRLHADELELGGVTINEFSNDGALAGASAQALVTESAAKTYTDSQVATADVVDAAISEAEGFVRKSGAGAYEAIKSNLNASLEPAATDDSSAGYAIGSVWIQTGGGTSRKYFICLNAAVGAATWADVTQGLGWSDPVDSSIVPDLDDNYDLGSATKAFKDVYIKSKLELFGNAITSLLDTNDDIRLSASDSNLITSLGMRNYVDFLNTVSASTGFTVGGQHLNSIANCSHATGFTVELPRDSKLSPNNTIGFSTMLRQSGDGPITIGDDAGFSTILFDDVHFTLQTGAKEGAVLAVYVATDTWWVTGDLKRVDDLTVVPIQVLDADTDAAVADGAGGIRFFVPDTLNGEIITGVRAFVATAGTTGTMDIQLHNVTQAVDILTNKLQIASGSKVSDDGEIINTANDDLTTDDEIRVDIDAIHTTAAKGLWVELQTQKQ